MENKGSRILVVEDDATLGKALYEAFHREGFAVTHVAKPDEAIAAFKLQSFQAVLIDCMLPGMNGVDLAKKFRQEGGDEFYTMLMSGVIKDKVFAKDALLAAKAQDFVAKPFTIPDVLKKVQSGLNRGHEYEVDPLYQLFTKEKISNQEKLSALLHAFQIHGFDLPLIYTLLVEAKISGHLILTYSDGQVGGVTFSQGRIVQVNSRERESYFGILLVEKGYISKEELDAILAQPSAGRIGERLVENSLLSPHAIQIIAKEQMAIRLSSSIEPASIEINFVPCEIGAHEAFIDSKGLSPLLHDWISAKLTLSWLKSFYNPWMENNLIRGPSFEKIKAMPHLPLVLGVKPIIDDLSVPKALHTFHELFESGEEKFYRGLHFLLIQSIVRFDKKAAKRDYKALLRRLKKLDIEFANQNAYELLRVTDKVKDKEIQRSFQELDQVLNPSQLEEDAPRDVTELMTKVHSKVVEAYNLISDESKRKSYTVRLEAQLLEQMAATGAHFEDGKKLLARGEYHTALTKFEEVAKGRSVPSNVRIYIIWCRIKLGPRGLSKDSFQRELDFEFSQVPTEERHNAHFLYIRGLYLKIFDSYDKAFSLFEKAASLDQNFLEPRREINKYKARREKTNIFQADLRDVVGMLFGKKNR